ncbi:hypothetical protein HH213_17955 [Duganella dendranthematis]|uniref:Phage tail tape measure protein n=1 Tax=Duganella dendranthematis TaxID=2728021 RepID=A0ABX6MBU8_9BURK|nr:hypothetical protein [Duganella dendranthematis]QJD91807.1 hypothetical protein HH213_17955 [Duganella dendranthematis]
MANNFQITITAIDRATAVVRRINAGMARITQPITNIRRAAGALSKELGFDKVGAAVGGAVKSVRQLGGQLMSLLGPLGIIAGGGTLAGIAALATEWGRMGSEISRSASMLDMSAGKLQALRGAGALAGVGAHELESGLKSLGDTMEDALYGRNQQALVVLNRLGVGIHKTKDGSIDAARGFRDLAGAIAATKNVQVQGLIARTFGLEAALPLLRKGPQAIEEYERKVASLGGVMGGEALAAAVKFKESLSFLDIAVQGVRNTIGEKLQPVIGPLIEQLTAWVAANRELISTKVAEFVQGVADWISRLDFKAIGEQVRQFCSDIETLVDKFGGWQNAAGAVVLAMNAGLLAGVIDLGLSIGKLAVVSVPVLIRGFGLLAAATDASLVPAIVRGLTNAALYTATLAEMAAGIPVVGSLLGGLSMGFASVGAAIAATPVGWLIAGAVAVAASVYAIYKNWDNITAYFSEKFAGIKAAFQKNWLNGIVKALWEFNPVKILADAMNGLSKWLFDFDLYDAGKSLINRLIGGVKSVATMLPKSVLKFLGIEGWANAPVQVSAAVAPATVAKTSAPVPPSGVIKTPAPGAPTVQTSAQQAAAPLGVRNNNPGNLRQWGDMPRDAKGYAMFPTPQAGLDAAIKNLRAQQQVHGLSTIEGIISKWAPPSENNTGAYISDVVKRTGFGAKQRLNLDDPATVAPLISSIIKHEGNGAAYSEEMINKAVAAQLGSARDNAPQSGGPQQVEMSLTLHGLPAGVTASAQTKGGQTTPVRVAYSMPTGITP